MKKKIGLVKFSIFEMHTYVLKNNQILKIETFLKQEKNTKINFHFQTERTQLFCIKRKKEKKKI